MSIQDADFYTFAHNFGYTHEPIHKTMRTIQTNTLREVELLVKELMNKQWDFEDLYGGPRSLNIVKDMGCKFKWDNAKLRFGSWQHRRLHAFADDEYTLTLSKPLCSVNLDKIQTQIKDTILHEIAHALVHMVNPHDKNVHGLLWQHIARQIGCSGNIYYSGENIKAVKAKYTLICPTCGKETSMYKRPKRSRSCGACSGGRYNEQHKLIVRQNY